MQSGWSARFQRASSSVDYVAASRTEALLIIALLISEHQIDTGLVLLSGVLILRVEAIDGRLSISTVN